MKFKLQAGEVLDVLTPDEAREILLELLEQSREAGLETEVRADESAVTDAAGAVTFTVYQVPVGRAFRITRLVIDADGFTPGAPFKNGVGFIDVLRGDERVDFVNLATGIPALSVDSKDSGARWRNGEQVRVSLVGGPASTSVRAKLQGFERTPGHDRPARTRGT